MTTQTVLRSPWAGHADAAELERWTAVAETVAAELARDAVDRDRAGAAPVAELELLRSSGLVNLLIPRSAGGEGGHWETAFAAVRAVARADASIGQILGYHFLNSACITFYGAQADQEAWYRASAASRWVWADAFNPVDPDLQLVADGEGYRLSGTKHFATGAAAADRLISAAVATGGEHDGELVVFALDARGAGVEHLDNWDHLGQRASASGAVRFTEVAVAAADIIGVDTGEPFSSVVTPGVQLLFGNIYLAIAEGALARARGLTLARKNSWFLSGVETYAQDPVVHRLYGGLVAKTQAVRALADQLNRRYDDVAGLGAAVTAADRAGLEVAVAGLKVVSTEVGLEVASRVFEATGASSTANAVGLDVYWRNIRTHSLHDPVDYKKIEVGANFLNGTVQPVSLYT
ncbi:acyl-CoA dehydrogenase family protein [Arthrobacter sp. I2-34]|uniref:Dibenzothiophene monooxygenase n=1 Tax=Arthrobacter hankyongi TaxID=2904801 RepID=A0ABS9L242_9MICC|nr:acyl-CoA dehydrogenase family protein [Arthrobacter hankyongi]MCG2620745.1 acyl-CoA dehydrogenase family protein [Arthrobacter hankyongi]